MEVLAEITEAGTSLWLDDLSRERLNGSLNQLIQEFQIRGVTTNPAIFSAAISGSDLYQSDIARYAREGLDVWQIVEELTTEDVRRACDLFHPIFNSSGERDGRVSIEVDPSLARDTEATIAQGLSLASKVGRPNLLIKVPATKEGLPAITRLTSSGISVNVTLIFSLSRYRQVIDAYMRGLEERVQRGESLSGIHSVASFFVSRVDTEVDARLNALGDSGARRLRGKAAVANAVLAYRLFEEEMQTQRWRTLSGNGANLQRPLWASTGVKDPLYRPTLYVDTLIAPHTVNTMPEATLKASASLKSIDGLSLRGSYSDSEKVISGLTDHGIDLEQVAIKLEEEGLKKFVDPWLALGETVRLAMC